MYNWCQEVTRQNLKQSTRNIFPWTFFQNIRFNMVPLNPFMSHLDKQLGYSTGEFQDLQLIVFVAFGVKV